MGFGGWGSGMEDSVEISPIVVCMESKLLVMFEAQRGGGGWLIDRWMSMGMV